MAEIKNNFINCKMNKDIDDRLLPNGQYREARNLQVSRSEGANVGALQNVLGTEIIVDFNDLNDLEGLECIGTYVDATNNNIYIFLTDYTNPFGPVRYNPNANNFIYVYNVLSGIPTCLVKGEFLNFSTTNPIYGVNLLENLLFWTDNRNQPRKINVKSAFTYPGDSLTPYYYTEDQISVAKLNPYQPIELYKQSEIPGVTDEYETTMYDVASEFLPSPNPGSASVNGAVIALTTIILDNFSNNTRFQPIPDQIVSGSGVVVGTRVVSYDPDTFTLIVDIAQTLLDNTALKFDANPYYISNYAGDTQFLQNKFVRFSYRFRFDDGEYSLFAPFTQIAFIPKQDGYFTFLGYYNTFAAPQYIRRELNDEAQTYKSTIVEFMQNKINSILLQIPLPCPANELFEIYKITEIDILYKESDGLAVNVIDTIPTATVSADAGINEMYEYNYRSTKPYKTLPTKDITRVYDRTPVKALAQEIVSNRVVYGNYQDKFSYPKFLNYTVGYDTKSSFSIDTNVDPNSTTDTTSIIEYPNSSVKQNRTYQVGVILSDKFGRQSGVILSNATENISSLGASTVYVPYSPDPDISTYLPAFFPGLALNVIFLQPIQLQSTDNTIGWPGFYNGNPKEVGYNPLGWFTYKIVVKQTEQDYYNVYLPGLMAGYPGATPAQSNEISHAVLIGDNINKVPRDLKEVGPAQLQFRSSIDLFPRVNNIYIDQTPYCSLVQTESNEQFYPDIKYAFATSIATVNSLFNVPSGTVYSGAYLEFYEVDSNPLVVRLSTPEQLGINYVSSPGGSVINLAVLETNPDESRLDIFWETATTGLIDELNLAIGEGECIAEGIRGLNEDTFILNESMAINTLIAGPFNPTTQQNNDLTCSNMTMTVWDGDGNDVTTKFRLFRVAAGDLMPTPPGGPAVPYDTYFLYTNDYFYFGPGASFSQVFTFIFTVVTCGDCAGTSNVEVPRLSLINEPPTTNCPEDIIFYTPGDPAYLFHFFGENGSNAGQDRENQNLIWVVTTPGPFEIEQDPALPDTGAWLYAEGFAAGGTYNITVEVRDAGGGPGYKAAQCNITIQVSGDSGLRYYCDSGCGTEGETWGFGSYEECAADCFNQCRNFQFNIGANSGGGSAIIEYVECFTGITRTTTLGRRALPNIAYLCAQSILSVTPAPPDTNPITWEIVEGGNCG